MRLKNSLAEVNRGIRIFLDFAERQKLDPEVTSQIAVVIDEILNNIVSYAYPRGNEHPIDLAIDIRSSELTVAISDRGRPFNPFTKDPPDTTLPLEERQIGGLGIHLVRNLMDDVIYTRSGSHNIVTLVKKI